MHVERDPHRPDPPPGVAHRDGPSSFAQLVGYTAQTLTRTAVAEYEQPVAMGSPSNVLGNEPIGPLDVAAWSNDATHTPNLWANVKGPQSTKGTGDSTAAYQCGGLGALQNCANNVQADYSNAGYFYKVQVDRKAHPGQHLVIQVYDPAAIDVGDHCDHNNIQNAATKVNPHTNAADALVRYAWGDTSNNPVPGSGAFCSGDYNDEDVGHPPTTTYLVRRDLNPYAETTNPPVPVGTCAGTQFTGFHGDVAAALDGSAGTYNDTVASNFRQWKPICSFIPDQYPSSDYLIQVRTNIADGASQTAMAGTGDPTLNTGGSNRFSIRAAWVNGATVDNTGVQVFGDQAMGLYANAAAGQAAPNFYMARVLPAAAGQTLRIKLWDIGDCGGGCSQGNVVLTFTLPNNQTATCSVSIYYPASQNVGSSCSFPTWTSNYQADNNWLVIDLNLPSTYTCTTSDPFDCWVRMKYSTSNGALNDTTTWSAQLLGNPVRLIK